MTLVQMPMAQMYMYFADDATLERSSAADYYLVFYEGADNSGVFYNTDDSMMILT